MFDEDLTVFFRTDDLGTELVSGVNTINGIWDRDYIETLSVQGTTPTFLCSTEDADLLSVDDSCTIEGDTYLLKVKQLQDDTALTLLILELQ